MILMNEISNWLVEWFKKNCTLNNIEGYLQVNFFEAGMVESLEIIGLILDIEHKYNIKFTKEHFQDHRFSTILGLAEIIGELILKKEKI